MNVIERMQEWGIPRDQAKEMCADFAYEAGWPAFRSAKRRFVVALLSFGVSPINAEAFVNSLTVAQLMEAKEA